MDVFNKLKTLCNSCALVFSLAQEGTAVPQVYVEALAYLELYSRRKAFVNISWRHPPAHSWYRSEARFSRGDNVCTKCNMIEATPQHLLDCVALVCDDLLKRPDCVLEVMKANDLMDLI
ncbi:hypothetical protein AVEN_123958-1 [Araneus ventricosus]|uniref:Uncharacterized protein n=1 Tax=Araneus ventricosus TaxID=182803 RepID=A0A4Y2SUS3_ARAVE|nr:hypothetical protein AVEN_255992-1 [Araneus ventricosus]GBN92079.1 hypothetical protein AVEN_123958-1 [Araneus ventricosus]